jgi:PmbA protein
LTQELLLRAEDILRAARRAGADDAEVFAQHAAAASAVVEKDDLQMARIHEESAFGVRAFVGDRVGFSSTDDLHKADEICHEAVLLARAAPRDPGNLLAPGSELPVVEGLYDPSAEEFTSDRAVERAIEMLEIAHAVDRRVLVGDAEFTARRSELCVANTRGVCAYERKSIFLHSIRVTARDGDLVSNMDFQFGATRRAASVDVGPAVRRACANALDSLGTGPGLSFRGKVLLSPQAVEAVLVPLLLFQLNGRNVLRRQSRWAEALGQSVAFRSLSLADDALIPAGEASAAFDREGLAHAPITLIEQGRLCAFLHNVYSSALLGQINSAHAVGSARSIPGIGPTNLAIAPGSVSQEDLIADTRKGLLVTRFSGNVDPVSGDFSGVAKGASLIECGKISRAVHGTLIAGNLFEALRSPLDLTRERETFFGLTLPTIRLADVSVTASPG